MKYPRVNFHIDVEHHGKPVFPPENDLEMDANLVVFAHLC